MQVGEVRVEDDCSMLLTIISQFAWNDCKYLKSYNRLSMFWPKFEVGPSLLKSYNLWPLGNLKDRWLHVGTGGSGSHFTKMVNVSTTFDELKLRQGVNK